MELEQFVKNYVEGYLGYPHGYIMCGEGFIINIPRKGYKPYKGWRAEWEETVEDLIDELRRADFGDYGLRHINPTFIELEKV